MANSNRLILVTNDDGVNTKGIEKLANIASDFGKVVVVAPIDGQSGMSHAITIKTPLRIRKEKEQNGVEYYACNGTPVDAVKLAINRILGQKPDLLLSGINFGSNAATSIVYSGTMAAAIEGCINNIPSAGFSILDWDEDADLSHTGVHMKQIIENIIAKELPMGICLNVNMPRLNGEAIKGIKICRQNLGYWQEEFDLRTDPHNNEYYWLKGKYVNLEPDATDTDEWALKHNYISIVPVKIDFTCHNTMEQLRHWENIHIHE
jgi:5'-nucleotidase